MRIATRVLIGAIALGVFSTVYPAAQDPPPAGGRGRRHKLSGDGGATGMLTTAGRLLFAGDGSGNFVAFDPATGKPLWHSRVGNVSNAAQTYMLDGKQYVLVAAGDSLFAFALY
jgi:alcohol dehydrogenase (cytochrome c)